MGPRPDALTAAIEQAWRVFDIPASSATGVCIQCCMDPKKTITLDASHASLASRSGEVSALIDEAAKALS